MRLKALIFLATLFPALGFAQDFRARYTGEMAHLYNVLPDGTKIKSQKRFITKIRVSFIYRNYVAKKIKLVTRTAQLTIPVRWRKTFYRTAWYTNVIQREGTPCREWLRLYFEPVDETLFVTTSENVFYCPGRKYESWTALGKGVIELKAVNEG